MRDTVIETFKHAGRTILIHRDEDAESPRRNDNLATLAYWHRRAVVGDEEIHPCSEQELRESVGGDGDVLAILPLYLYQHSGMTVRTTPFSCSYDSGQVGWAYVTRASAEAMGCVGTRWEQYEPAKRSIVGTWDQAALEDAIRAEVKEFDDYLCGRCFGFQVLGADGKEIDSCWGFVGDLDYVRLEARQSAEGSEDPAVQAAADELEARATYAAGGAA